MSIIRDAEGHRFLVHESGPREILPRTERDLQDRSIVGEEVNNLNDKNFRYVQNRKHDPYYVTLRSEKTITRDERSLYTLKSSPIDFYFDIHPNRWIQGEECIAISCNIRDTKGNLIGNVYVEDVNREKFFNKQSYREDRIKELQTKVFSKILGTKGTCKQDNYNHDKHGNNETKYGVKVGLEKVNNIKGKYI